MGKLRLGKVRFRANSGAGVGAQQAWPHLRLGPVQCCHKCHLGGPGAGVHGVWGGLPWSPGGASTCIQPFHPSETRGNSPQILLLLLLGMSLRSCPSCTHSPSGTHLPRGRSPSPPGAHKSLHSRPRPLPDHASSLTPPQPRGPPHCPEAFAHACSLPGSSFHRSGCCWALDRFCPFPCSSPGNAPHPLRRGPRGHSLHAP